MIPTISISELVSSSSSSSSSSKITESQIINEIDERIGRACVEVGFFVVVDHGISKTLQRDLENASREFFQLSVEKKREIHMSRAGKSWRGWFAVGEELTSSIVDEKEGIYFGTETPFDQRPLHGSNLYGEHKNLARVVPLYMNQMERLGRILLQSIARFLKLSDFDSEFAKQFRRPTCLFRCFRYRTRFLTLSFRHIHTHTQTHKHTAPHDPTKFDSNVYGVGEHTDYGYLTILKTDGSDGLQVKTYDGRWYDVPHVENGFVINLGDALEHNTQGLLRATPHRVVQRKGATRARFSWPFFFDPDFDSEMVSVKLPPSLACIAKKRRMQEQSRWDGKDPLKYRGTYGEYLMAKVSKVFPELAQKSKL